MWYSVASSFDIRLALFGGAQAGYFKQGFTGESFYQGLIFGGFQAGYEVGRDLLEDSHKLGYSGPGDAEMVASGSLCSLRVFDQIFPHLDGHGYDILVDWRGGRGREGKGSYKLMDVPFPRLRYIFTSICISLHLERRRL